MTIVVIEATPVKATSLVASTRSVKFRRNHVPTPQTAMISHSKYHAGGYDADSIPKPLESSPLLFRIEILLAIVLPLFARPARR